MDEQTKDLLTKNLNSIIQTCLGGPPGDPDCSHLKAAATAFATLELLGLKIRNRKETHKGLKEQLEEWGM